MTLILRQVFVFFKLLNSERGANQISAGVVCGVILGLAPAISFQSVIVFLVIFLFRVQFGAALATAFFVKLVALPFDPVFHEIGAWVLQQPLLEPLFTWFYNVPIVPWTRFYNSIVMGSAVVSLALAPIVFVGSRMLIERYRRAVVSRFKDSRFWKFWKATSFYNWYQRYDQLF